MEYTRRYLMDGLHNLRDLGGYTVPGGITRFGVLRAAISVASDGGRRKAFCRAGGPPYARSA